MDFLKKTTNKKRSVFVENKIPPLEKSEAEAIKKHGFSGQVVKLSEKEKVSVICPEPNWDWILDFAIKKTKDRLLVGSWIFTSAMSRFSKNSPIQAENVEEIKNTINYLENKLKIKKPYKKIREVLQKKPYSINLEKNLEDIWKSKIDYQKISEIQNPFKLGTKINRVGAIINLGRDEWIAKKILNSLKNRESVFASFGLNHVICQKPLFEWYFGKKSRR